MREVPKIEHEHDDEDEHDSPKALLNALVTKVTPKANETFLRPAAQFEICSRARLRVRGPINATASNASSIAAAMKTNTPATPECSRTKAITKPVKIAENRLQE